MTAKRTTPRRANGEGSIRWNAKRQRYDVAVSIRGTGRRLTGRAVTKRDAAQLLAQLQRAANEQAPPAPIRASESYTVETWLDYWQRTVFAVRPGRFGTGVSKNHKRRTAWAVAALSDALGHHKLAALRTAHVVKMLEQRAAGIGVERRAWSQETCKNVRNVLADALDDAINQEAGIVRNVARKAGGFAAAAPPETQYALTREQADKLYRAARDSANAGGAVIALLVTTGMRQSEARELRWGAVDLQRGTLTVVKAKTPLGLRTIALAPQALDVLHSQRALAGSEPHPDDYVFPGPKSDHVGAHLVTDELTRLCDQLSLYVGDDDIRAVHPHELRHTVATLLLDALVPLRDVAAMLRDKPETISRVYDKLLRGLVGADAIAPLVSIFGSAA